MTFATEDRSEIFGTAIDDYINGIYDDARFTDDSPIRNKLDYYSRVATPLLIFAVMRPLAGGALLGVVVVLAAMPVATNGTMFCYQYGGDAKTMAQGTFITTVLALVTIPLLATFSAVL